MKRMIKLLFILLVPSLLLAEAQKVGTVSVLLFSEGKPLASNEVKLDGKEVFKTDKDGAMQTSLSVGKHQIEIFGKDSAGNNLGYFKKSITIQGGKDTQVIATLSKKGADTIDIDTPVKTSAVKERTEQKATGEGTLVGTVLSSEAGTPISGARVFVRGTSVDVRTDANGKFTAKVPAGITLSISVVHSAYSAQTIGNIKVQNNGKTFKTVKLTPASMELEEFVVLAPKVTGSIAEVMQEEKQSSAVTNILGSEEMSKKGDSDAASALKRVTGVTLVGSKVYVRGLGDRYSNTEMNSMPLPSPDPSKRAVPLDIFPSGVISSLKVQKSGTADIPASFGGGYVDIRTKEKSNDDYIKISIGAKGSTNTGKEVPVYEGGDNDWTGYDGGYRALPARLLNGYRAADGKIRLLPIDYPGGSSAAEEKELERALLEDVLAGRKYDFTDKKLPVGMSVGIEGAYTYEIDDDHKLSIFVNYGYSQEHTYVKETITKAVPDTLNPDPDGTISKAVLSTFGGEAFRTTSEYSNSGIINIGYSFADIFDMRYTKLYTHTGQKVTRYTEGQLGSNQDYIHFYDLEWEERTLTADQLNGEADYEVFSLDHTFSFGIEKASAQLHQPNNTRIGYISDPNKDDDPILQTSSSFNYVTALESKDDVKAFYLKNRTYLNIFDEKDYVEIGYAKSRKNRRSDQFRFGIAPTVSGLTGKFDPLLEEYLYNTDTGDEGFALSYLYYNAFEAQVDETSKYINFSLKPWSWLDVMFGIRQVDIDQKITSFSTEKVSVSGDDQIYCYYSRNRLKCKTYVYVYSASDSLYEIENELFPSASLKFKINKYNSIDVAYSKTFIMPDLREATPDKYSHPTEIADVFGRASLEHTVINSYDLKYSHYFSDTESVKIGLFYKELTNPIEDTEGVDNSLPKYTFTNAESATIYGIEVDGRKELNFIHNWLDNFFLSGNLAFIKSEVQLNEQQLNLFTSHDRELQGLSPIVINLALSYETSDRSVTLAYNKMGERIRRLGQRQQEGTKLILNPDTIEVPADILDFIWIENFDNGLGVKLKVGNILDSETLWYKYEEDVAIKTFKTGVTFSVSASYKF